MLRESLGLTGKNRKAVLGAVYICKLHTDACLGEQSGWLVFLEPAIPNKYSSEAEPCLCLSWTCSSLQQIWLWSIIFVRAFFSLGGKKEETRLWSSSSRFGGSSSSRDRFLSSKHWASLCVTSIWELNSYYCEPSARESVSAWVYVFMHMYKIEHTEY